MTDLSLAPRISLLDLVARMFPRRPVIHETPEDPDAARARRAFIMDKLADNPEAFGSEYDVQAMMALYTRTF